MDITLKHLLPVLLAVAVQTTAQAETQGATREDALACPSINLTEAPREPGELVRELYRIVSGPAGKPKDWQRLRALHAPGAVITTTQHKGDRVLATTYNVEQFSALNDKLFAQRGFYEIELRQEVQRFGHVAHVWSAYSSGERAEGPPDGFGINSFQLLNDGQRWCVLSATWDGDPARHRDIREWAGLPETGKH